jgi:hypothetical protein
MDDKLSKEEEEEEAKFESTAKSGSKPAGKKGKKDKNN